MLINFYISNLDLLDRFILYFRNTAKKLIDKAVKQKLKTPQTQNELTRDLKAIYDEAIWQNEKRSQFVCETGVEKYFFENKTSELSLSKRDIDCILYLFQGKSANEISRKLYLSKRTVESRLDTLKMKLNCQGKSELIPKLLRMGLRFSCDREGRLFVTD
jgi:DNA-binding CsgD family transcriptional regulator